MRRADQSGLTRGSDWNNACAAASSWPESSASEFFSRYFEAVQIGDGAAFVTGYYEPEIAGSRSRQPGYDVPIYRRPSDLIDVDLGQFSDSLKGRSIRGKVQGTKFVPYDARSQIVAGSLAGRGLELAWAADPVEFFFLQIQGSGRLLLPDGGVMRIGYDGQNGRDYTGIGKLMKDRGLIQAGSMQDIMRYLRANPAEGAGSSLRHDALLALADTEGADGAVGRDSGHYVFRVGEHNGAETTRVAEVVSLLNVIDGAYATNNLWGERWAKLSQNSMGNAISASTVKTSWLSGRF